MRNRTPDSSNHWYHELQSENTQALLDRLEAEMDKEEIEDIDLIDAITTLLDERAPVPVTQESPEESLRKFRAEYAPLLDSDFESKKAHLVRRRVAQIVLAACLCITMLFAVASACGINLIAEFLEWREETFVLRGRGSGQMVLEQTPEGEYASMEEAVAAYGITDPVVPTWIPKGFAVQHVKVKERLYSTDLTAVYTEGDREIILKVYLNKAEDDSAIHAEHSVQDPIPYERNGNEFLLAENNKQWQASWTIGNCVCSINGDLTEHEIKQMINSIFVEEG